MFAHSNLRNKPHFQLKITRFIFARTPRKATSLNSSKISKLQNRIMVTAAEASRLWSMIVGTSGGRAFAIRVRHPLHRRWGDADGNGDLRPQNHGRQVPLGDISQKSRPYLKSATPERVLCYQESVNWAAINGIKFIFKSEQICCAYRFVEKSGVN